MRRVVEKYGIAIFRALTSNVQFVTRQLCRLASGGPLCLIQLGCLFLASVLLMRSCVGGYFNVFGLALRAMVREVAVSLICKNSTTIQNAAASGQKRAGLSSFVIIIS